MADNPNNAEQLLATCPTVIEKCPRVARRLLLARCQHFANSGRLWPCISKFGRALTEFDPSRPVWVTDSPTSAKLGRKPDSVKIRPNSAKLGRGGQNYGLVGPTPANPWPPSANFVRIRPAVCQMRRKTGECVPLRAEMAEVASWLQEQMLSISWNTCVASVRQLRSSPGVTFCEQDSGEIREARCSLPECHLALVEP